MPKYKIDYNKTLEFQVDLGEILLDGCSSDNRSCKNCKQKELCFFNIKFTSTLLRYKQLGLF